MNRDEVEFLFRYNSWAWDRVLAQAAQVTPEQYTAPGAVPHGSLRGTLVHAMSAEWNWLRRWMGDSPASLLKEADYPTFGALLQEWQPVRHGLAGFAASLTEERLAETLHYKTSKGVPMEDTLWRLVMHVIVHGAQHRSEAAMLLTEYRRSPGDLDLIIYARETG